MRWHTRSLSWSRCHRRGRASSHRRRPRPHPRRRVLRLGRVVTDATGAARAVDLDGHLDRLACSAQAMAIGNPSRDQWRLWSPRPWRRSSPGEAVLKLVLTRGRERRASVRWPSSRSPIAGPGPRPTMAPEERHGPSRPSRSAAATRPTPSPTRPGSWAVSRPCPTSSTPPPRERHDDAGPTRSSSRRPTVTPLRVRPPGCSSLEMAPSSARRPAAPGSGVAHRGGHLGGRAPDGFATGYELVPVEDLYTADALWLVSSGRGPVLVTTLDGRTLRADPSLASRVTRYAGF